MKDAMKWKKSELFFIMIILIFMTLLAKAFYQHTTTEAESNIVTSLGQGWYQVRDGERIDLELPASVMSDSEGKIILYNDSLTAEDSGKTLSSRGVQDNLEIYMGDKILYHYQDNIFHRNKQMKGKIWADINLPDNTGKESLRFIFKDVKDKQLYIQAPLIGSFVLIVRQHILDYVVSGFIILAMFCLSIISVIIFLYTRYRGIIEKRFLNVAFFLILCGFWCILDSGIYQMYGKQCAKGTLLSFYAFMLMSVPMLHFVQNTVSRSVQWVPQIWIFLLYMNAVLQGCMNLVFKIPFIHMLFITHLLLFTGIISMTYLLWKEYQRNRTQELNLALKAFVVLGLSGVTALALYWILSIYWYDAVFQFGILLYIAILFWGLLCKVFNDVQFHLEQIVYERMSLEDRMTGLKNRKAFEQDLEKIQEDFVLIRNALLLFIDIAGLKNINDAYGMQMGDEAVIRTARSVQVATDTPLEQKLECYRVDGDEFAVVVINPQILPDEWIRLIKDEINKESGSKCYIRLKFGYSYLRQADGTINSISNWKMQADSMLRVNTIKPARDRYDL